MTVMQAALAKYGSKELAGLIEEVNYSPALIDLLVKAGSGLKSDSLVTGEQSRSITGSEQAAAEIKRLEADTDFMVKLSSKNHTGHNEAVRKMAELYNIVYSA